MNASRITTAGLALLASAAFPTLLQAQATPEIVVAADRGAEVVFAGDCAVRFDAQGRRTSSLSGCSTDELARADVAYADYRRAQEWDAPAADDAAPGRPAPRLDRAWGGETRVDLGGGCSVRYEAGGGRTMYDSACSVDQLTRSDVAYAAYRVEQGWDAPPADAATEGGIPPQIIDHASRSEVVFEDDCVVSYAEGGRRTRSLSACSGDQIARADAAMAIHLQEQETEGEPAEPDDGGGLPDVVVSNGFGRVAFPGGCTVTYNDLGRRTETTRLCDASEVERADEAMAAHGREQSP